MGTKGRTSRRWFALAVAALCLACATVAAQGMGDQSSEVAQDVHLSFPVAESAEPVPPLAPNHTPEPYEPNPMRGFRPTEGYLSTFQATWDGLSPAANLSRFDWRDSGKVTSVKNQGACGSCYAFAYLGLFESKLLIDNAGTWDFSENHAKECEYSEASCGLGGNGRMMTNLFSQTGSVLESCDPYVPADVACKTGCPYQKTILDWREIANGTAIPDTTALKNYIQTYGPVMASLYTGSLNNAWYQEFNAYRGGYTLYYTGTEETNHAVLLVGWDDSLTHAGGTGGWIVKNSWGTGWGDNGYFTIAYGSASIGAYSSFIYDWQDYDPHGSLLHYDEGSYHFARGWSTTSWGLVKILPPADTRITRVEFWTTDRTTDVDVYLYDNFNGATLSTLLAQKLNNAFNEPGYHSVELDAPVPVSAGNDVIAVVKFTNESFAYPVAVDPDGPHETGRTYISGDGAPGSWYDLGAGASEDVSIRIRTSSQGTATSTATRTRTRTPTRTATRTATRTGTRTATATRTRTPTRRPTNTPGPSSTWVPGTEKRVWLPIVFRQWNPPSVATSTPTATRTATRTPTPTRTPTSTITRTATRTPTRTSTTTPAGPAYLRLRSGDARTFADGPEVSAYANTQYVAPPGGVAVTRSAGATGYYQWVFLPSAGQWIQASYNTSITPVGVQFWGDQNDGWARVLVDGTEVWRGTTYGTSGDPAAGAYVKYLEISGLAPGVHTVRVECLGINGAGGGDDVTILLFGFGVKTLAAGICGRVTCLGQPAGGVSLGLRYYDGAAWTTRLTTTTDATGRYCFTTAPTLAAGQWYYVRYGLNNTNPANLSWWSCPMFSAYTGGARKDGGQFDLADFALSSPADGSALSVPVTFAWQPRAVLGETYRWALADLSTGDIWESADLGHASTYTLTGLPPGVQTGKEYAWYARAYNGSGHYGATYHYHRITFSTAGVASPDLGALEFNPAEPDAEWPLPPGE